MDPRHILYLTAASRDDGVTSSDVDGIFPAIASAGWRVHVAPDFPSASFLLEEYPFGVGMVWLEPASGGQFRRDMDVWCRDVEYMPWVALISRDTRDNEEIRQFVSESFYDYHTLPLDLNRLLATLGHAHGMAMIGRTALNPEPARGAAEEPQMVAVCAPMQSVFQSIRRIAAVDAAVVITGESGTGKELAARAIHERSRRSFGPFIAINCAALPAELIQSELFGYEKGAFTGAQRRNIGSIEAANGGTLFLDEIGDLPPNLQVNLLRFLQESTIQRLGSPKEIPVDVRVIAATHCDVEKAVAAGHFREDLYYRLYVLHLDLPPLRARGEDIEVLALFYFEVFSRESAHPLKGFSAEALRSMASHTWPGNVRELINRVRRAIVMCEGGLIIPSDLGFSWPPRESPIIKLEEARAVAERQAISLALKLSPNNISQVARALGTSRPKLYRLMAKHGLTP